MSMTRTLTAIAALLAVHAAVPTETSAAEATKGQKTAIQFSFEQGYPESVSWSTAAKAFFVSSVRHGTVGKVAMDGRYEPFIEDDRLVSSLGVLADDERNTVWVAIADPGVGDRTSEATKGKLAAVAAYDETTGERRGYYDLGGLAPGSHLANDMTLDDQGNVYVTDSFAPIVYRVDTSGTASIFARNPLFKDGDGFNLNGIRWFKEGFLIVGKYNSGELLRVSVDDPTQVDRVALPEPLKGADGLHKIDDQHLVVVQNLGVDRTVELVSSDGWKSSSIVRASRSGASMPSAATGVGEDVYVLDSRIDTLFDAKAAKVSTFALERF